MDKLLTPKDVAQMLGVSEWTLMYGGLNGVIPKVRVLSKTRYKEQDVQNYINKSTERLTCLRR